MSAFYNINDALSDIENLMQFVFCFLRNILIVRLMSGELALNEHSSFNALHLNELYPFSSNVQ